MSYNFIYINDFIKQIQEKNESIFAGKTKKSIIIGPYTGTDFNFKDFYKRLVSSAIFDKKMYKKVSEKSIIKLIKQNNLDYKSLENTMIEYYKDGNIVTHKFISVPQEEV